VIKMTPWRPSWPRYDTGFNFVPIPVAICDDCGHITHAFVEGKNITVCIECLPQYYRCSNCDNLVRLDDALEVDSLIYCEDCYNSIFPYTCTDCGSPLTEDDACFYGDDPYCEECFDENFHRCDYCDEPVPVDDVYWDPDGDFGYCESCFWEIYTTCDACGDIVSQDDAHYTDGGVFCPYCYQEHAVIRDYSYKPPPLFHKLAFENTVYMGIELEVEVRGKDPVDVAKHITTEFDPAEELFYLKYDGSLRNGFELVTHPFTWKAFHDEFPWKELTSALAADHAEAAGTCGIHVHVSRSALPEGKRGWGKVLVFFLRTWFRIVLFSLREDEAINRWAKPWSAKEVKDYLTHGTSNHDRYRAINFCRRTVEFRIFASSLDPSRIAAIVQFIDGLIEFAKNTSLPFLLREEPGTIWREFLGFLRRRGYHHAWREAVSRAGTGC